MPNLRNGSKVDSNPGSLDCESGFVPLSRHIIITKYEMILRMKHMHIARKLIGVNCKCSLNQQKHISCLSDCLVNV